jgi:uncharacterized protein YjcR
MSTEPRRWTEQRLAQCRALFESGMKTSEIGAKFGITASTVSVMAWQRKWQRKVKPQQAARMVAVSVAAGDDAATVDVAVTARERNFNARLQQTIAEYWRAQGRKVELHVEEQGGDLLGIRSKSVNGVPVKG